MAGREISGALAARGDLFEGRIWIYTPSVNSDARSVEVALEVISELGARAVLLGAAEHDQAIAGISHLPQVVSSLLSASLTSLPERDINLAGQGLKDVSRLAASNPELWATLLHSNRVAVGEFLQEFARNLEDLSTSLQNDDLRKTQEILEIGRENHARIPGKHGGKKRDYWYLPIIIDDKPGQLARIFDACALVEANVEDLSIEHTPGQESGLVTLALSQKDSKKVFAQLEIDGWKVHEPRESIG
jgi:prephenate dehydrogenase